ncbi:MAG: MlaD family protein, partial [Marmoricola sp.]
MIAGFKAILVKFSLFALVAVLLGYLLVNTMLHGLSGETVNYRAEFSDVSGLRSGDDIRVAGVRVGRVQNVKITTAGAEVDFSLVKRQKLLTTTTLVMRYQNLLGQRYLAMVQGKDRGAVMKA